MVTGTPLVKKKKKKPALSGCEFLLLGVMAGIVCCGKSAMWWPAKLHQPSGKKKEIQPFDGCVVGTMICGHCLSLFSGETC
jgi:hypothetical protein